MTDAPFVDDPLPSLLRVVVPPEHELWAGETRVIVCSVELWTGQFVIHLVIPHQPGDDETTINYEGLKFFVSDDVGTDYRHVLFSSVETGPSGFTTFAVGAYQPVHPQARELYVPLSDGTRLVVPIPPA